MDNSSFLVSKERDALKQNLTTLTSEVKGRDANLALLSKERNALKQNLITLQAKHDQCTSQSTVLLANEKIARNQEVEHNNTTWRKALADQEQVLVQEKKDELARREQHWLATFQKGNDLHVLAEDKVAELQVRVVDLEKLCSQQKVELAAAEETTTGKQEPSQVVPAESGGKQESSQVVPAVKSDSVQASVSSAPALPSDPGESVGQAPRKLRAH